MHREKYWASKVPLPLALLFLVNVFLIVGAELLFFYKYPAKPEGADLAKYNAVYEDSDVFIRDDHYSLIASLANTNDGQTHLVVTKTHPLFYSRGKIVYAQPVEMPEAGEVLLRVKTGIHTSEIEIKDIPTGVWSVNVLYGNTGNVREITVIYMVLAAVLEALELLVIHFIRKNLQ